MKAVYTFADLSSRELLDAGASKPAKLAVIGMPVAHSASPQMHQAALDALGIDARYIRLELTPNEFQPALQRLAELDFIGCNVTVPHKFLALESCDDVHPDARTLGSVNTIRFDADAIRGFNTDGPGFAEAIQEAFGQPLSSLKVAIAGAAGGAGQAIATQCLLSDVQQLVLINRSADKLAELATRLQGLHTNTRIIALGLDAPDLHTHCLHSNLLVNTSSLGLKAGDPSILPDNCIDRSHLVYDTIYQPPLTPFLQLAQSKGCRTDNGFSMLIHQGAIAFQLWFPGTHPIELMRQALR